jgi:hypothetical protein
MELPAGLLPFSEQLAVSGSPGFLKFPTLAGLSVVYDHLGIDVHSWMFGLCALGVLSSTIVMAGYGNVRRTCLSFTPHALRTQSLGRGRSSSC